MKCLALVVPRQDGERTRQRLAEGGWLRTDLRIAADPERISFPLNSRPDGEWVDSAIAEREFERLPSPAPQSYRDRLELPAEVTTMLPRAFDVVGDVVLVRLPKELYPWGPQVGKALLEFVPGARLVGLDHGVQGVERRRSLERLAGKGAWTTRHAENGLTLDVDLERAYFSPRLAREHARVAAQVGLGETVLDLCCGVGPFSLAIARDHRARRVIGVDLNPSAIALARANALRLGLAERVVFEEAGVEEYAPRFTDADRVIFNLPREGIKYLPQVAITVGPGGSLHFYEVTEMESENQRPDALRSILESTGGSWVPVDSHRVHAYSPTLDLMAYTLRRTA